ncbi:hypothetical protein [Aliiroseovarius crassostreae]|uniref:hypothetical protein n=1 Tax=Aliiroseovarius crassostreae TaxID=154981 RepID=UPI0022059739|nr:hypothetical protein [Aliiroseovarius crassostreae]UWQ07391.1 hypothetical protein K3X25_11515 [Aliiroseovarius crassostreae]
MSWKNRIRNILLHEYDWDSLGNDEIMQILKDASWARTGALIALVPLILLSPLQIFYSGFDITDHIMTVVAVVLFATSHRTYRTASRIIHDRMWSPRKTDDTNP